MFINHKLFSLVINVKMAKGVISLVVILALCLCGVLILYPYLDSDAKTEKKVYVENNGELEEVSSSSYDFSVINGQTVLKKEGCVEANNRNINQVLGDRAVVSSGDEYYIVKEGHLKVDEVVIVKKGNTLQTYRENDLRYSLYQGSCNN